MPSGRFELSHCARARLQPNCPGPLRRREFLQVGALALGGITLPEVLAARAASGPSGSGGSSGSG